MANYTTRIELHNSTKISDYEILHKAMESEGFSRTIFLPDTNIEYYLPTAEYNIISNLGIKEVLELARTAVLKTKLTYAILVTKGIRRWVGLEKVDK